MALDAWQIAHITRELSLLENKSLDLHNIWGIGCNTGEGHYLWRDDRNCHERISRHDYFVLAAVMDDLEEYLNLPQESVAGVLVKETYYVEHSGQYAA